MTARPQKKEPVRFVASSNWVFTESKILENLCDHPVVLRDDKGNEVTLLASPRPARCSVAKQQTALINIDNKVMLPVMRSEFTDVQNLPEPDPRRMFIVSLPVAKRMPQREDLFCVDALHRGKHNEVIYAQALARPL